MRKKSVERTIPASVILLFCHTYEPEAFFFQAETKKIALFSFSYLQKYSGILQEFPYIIQCYGKDGNLCPATENRSRGILTRNSTKKDMTLLGLSPMP